MWRIHFTPADIARVRLARGADPVCEIVRSLEVLSGRTGEPVFGQWRRRARSNRSWLRLAEQVAGGRADRRLMHCYFDRVLAPHWPLIRQRVDDETRRLAGAITRGGADRALSEASPLLRWEAPVLLVPNKPDELDIFLKGRGILLQPSFFAYDDCGVRELADGTQVLVYPVRQIPGWFDAEPVCKHRALRTLLGRTRAEVLERLAENRCTTSELAAILELSVASASQHAKVLREAGLVSSNQSGKAVVHKASALGIELLERAPGV